jgi:integrase
MRPGKVWWNNAKNAWYATIGGKKVRLASAEEGQDVATALWHKLKAKETAPDLLNYNGCETIFNLYLDHIKQNHPTTYDTHCHALQNFLARHPTVRVCDLRALHIEQWMNAHPTWADGTRHLNITVVVSALNWAAKPEQRYITVNPLRGISRPPAHSRGAETMISQDAHEKLLAVANDATKDLLTGLRQTGMRPSSICKITAHDCDSMHGVILIRVHKTGRRTGKPLAIPMSTPMRQLCERLCARHPTGAIFRTRRGKPWTPRYIHEIVLRLRREAGLSEDTIPYGYRHGLATELLVEGVPAPHVAAILGHKNTNMLFRHYSHLPALAGPLAEAIDKTLNGSAGPQGT